MRKRSERTSFLSRTKGKKEDFLRFAIISGRLRVDEEGKLGGRGHYLLREEIPSALKKKAFNKLVGRELSEEEREEIAKWIIS